MAIGRRSASTLAMCGALLVCTAGCGADSSDNAQDLSGGSDTQEFAPAPARGISILEVEVNQGTRIPIGVGGEWVAEGERLGYLIASRDSLLRVHYSVDAAWVPREIEARLTLDLPDGSSKSFTDVRMVEGDSSRADFNGPFRFDLVATAGEVVPGIQYSVELWELEPGGEDLPEGDWANPAGGPQPLGIEPAPMQIKTVLVPITYQDTTPNLDAAGTQLVVDNLYEQNPTTEIIYAVHDPVVHEGQLIDLANLLPIIADLRASENADPNTYYHALVDVGSSSLAGLYGISYIANDSDGDANSRVSATVWWSPNPSFAADTYTHETGHAQGLSHIECPTQSAAEPDPTYPHADGRIGNWGFGIRELILYDPDDSYDYMSYCGPSWVSDWTWNKTFQRIQTLTAWDFEASPPSDASGQLLVVAEYADGRRQWWTMPGAIDPERVDGLDRIEFELRSGEVIETAADVATLSDGRTRWIKAPLPDSDLDVAAVRHVRGHELASVPWVAVGRQRSRPWQGDWQVFRGRSR
jgi:hypothetical protein